jgi:hypothetical protein
MEMFLQKVHVEKNPEKNDRSFDVSFFSIFLVLSRFRVFLSDGTSKTLQKTFCKKTVSENVLQKIDQKNEKRFVVDCLFFTFSVRGVQKHHFKNIGGKSSRGPFLASSELTNPPRGSRTFFWPAPWHAWSRARRGYCQNCELAAGSRPAACVPPKQRYCRWDKKQTKN